MAAVTINDDQVAQVNRDRCIGCGLCVTTCPSEAIALRLKPEEKRINVPESGRELMEQTAEIRATSIVPFSMSGK